MEDLNQADGTTPATAAAAPAEPKVKLPGVGDKAKELIRAGLSNEAVLAGIKEAFPDAKTTMSSVNWYRNNLRTLGEDVPTARELSAAGKPSKEEADKAKAEKKANEKAAKDADKAEAKAKKEADKVEKKAAEKAAKDAAKAEAKAAADAAAADTPAADPATFMD